MEVLYKPPNTVYFITVVQDGSEYPITIKSQMDVGYTIYSDSFTAFAKREIAEEALTNLRAMSTNANKIFYLERRVARQKAKS